MTMNAGNYESVRVDAGIECDMEGDSRADAFKKLFKELRAVVDPKVNLARKKLVGAD